MCLRANPSVDDVGGTTVQKHPLRGRLVLIAAQVTAAAGGVVDHVAASLAGEILKRSPIHHGPMLQINMDSIRPI
jgi:hypothetical protein